VSPTGSDTKAKETTTAKHPALPLETTPASALATPTEKIPPAGSDITAGAASNEAHSLWRSRLSKMETFLYRIMHPTEPDTEPLASQPAAAQSQ
jgi:hypothetical protein